MKLVLIGPVYPFRGGIAHYTTILHRELLKAGHDVLLLSFRRQYPRWLFPGKDDRDPSTQAMKIAEARYLIDPLNPFSWVRAYQEIRLFQAQIVLLQWWHVFWAPAWLALGSLLRRHHMAQIAIICHNVLPHESHIWDRVLARAVLRLARRAVVQSSAEKATFLSLAPSTPVEVVPHPLYDMFAEEELSRETARQRLAIDLNVPVLLFFGFVRDYKGLNVLIDALPDVREAFPDVRLLIVGEFWQDKRIYERQIETLQLAGNVLVVDRYVPNEEVSLYFRAADLVILPYISVTQSGVLQLALGFGLPVVSTRVGGLPEAVTEGEDVILVEPENPRALSDAIVTYLQSPASGACTQLSRENSRKRWDFLLSVLIHERS